MGYTGFVEQRIDGMTMSYGFFFDSSLCTGCKTCQFACSDYHGLTGTERYRRVLDYEGGNWVQGQGGSWSQDAFCYHVSVSCNHCNQPVCTKVCPTGAMHKESNGLVLVNTTICVGCGYCTMACPYRAPFVSDVTHASEKCDGCSRRIADGLVPICVEACPMRALAFGDMRELLNLRDGVVSIAPLPEPETSPNIIIRASSATKMPGDEAGFIANPSEI